MAKKTKTSTSSAADEARFTDTSRVKKLIALMTDNGLTEIELVEDKSKIVLRRGGVAAAPVQYAAPAAHVAAPAVQHTGAAPAVPASDETAGLIPIKSPMVGTFYSSPNPESDVYVSVGSNVDEKTVVCIIEAMKVFNEIHAEVKGKIAKVLINNGQAVEFGQPLFLVKP